MYLYYFVWSFLVVCVWFCVVSSIDFLVFFLFEKNSLFCSILASVT